MSMLQASEIDEEGGMGTGGEDDLEDLDEEEDGDEIEGEDDVRLFCTIRYCEVVKARFHAHYFCLKEFLGKAPIPFQQLLSFKFVEYVFSCVLESSYRWLLGMFQSL